MEKASCPYVNVSACPYTKDTAQGCPYIDHLANGIIEPPAHCVVADAMRTAPPVTGEGAKSNTLVQMILDRIGKR